MSKTILNFDDIAVKKCISWIKYPIDLNGVHIGKIVISNKAWYGKKGLNTLLDTKMMIELNHSFIYFYHLLYL